MRSAEARAAQKVPVIRPARQIVTIPEMLERSASKFSQKTALQMRRKGGGGAAGGEWLEYTYGDLLRSAKQIAAGLTALGQTRGARIGLVGENHPDWVVGYFSILFAGGIVLPIDARLTPPERRHILRHSEASMLVAGEGFVDEALTLKDDFQGLVIVSMATRSDVPCYSSLTKDWQGPTSQPGPAPAGAPPIPGSPQPSLAPSLDDLAVILYTSGTTGSSKGVMLTHRNLMSNVEANYQVIDFDSDDNFFSVLPLHHVFEATAGVLTPLSVGATITYSRSLKPNEIREDLSATKATILIAVPLLLEKVMRGIYREVAKAPALRQRLFKYLTGATKGRAARILLRSVRNKTQLGSLRYIVSGGAALPSWVFQGLESLGFRILQGYGLSESSPVLTCNRPNSRIDRSVGWPVPKVEIRIEPDGEILARGPGIMQGYFHNPEATAEVLDTDGWLHTGDLGRLDEQGALYITGRKKYVIVTPGGKNIYPEEVEEALLVSPYIEEVLVLSGRAERGGDEQVEAVIFPNYDEIDAHFRAVGVAQPTKEDVYGLIKNEISENSKAVAEYKRPRRFTIRQEEFPKTTTKKIKRYLFTEPPIELEQ